MLTLLRAALLGSRVRSLVTALAVAVAVSAYLSVAFYFTVYVPQPRLPEVNLPADLIIVPAWRDLPAFEEAVSARWPEVRGLEATRLALAYTADGLQEILAVGEGSAFAARHVELVRGGPPGPGQVLLPVIEGLDWGVDVGEEAGFMFEPAGGGRWHFLPVSGFYRPVYRRLACPMVDMDTVALLDPWATYRYLVHLAPGADIEAVAASMDRRRDLVMRIETAAGVYEDELAREWKGTYQSVYNSARGMVALLTAVAAAGILNSTYIAFMNRQREMGILKALGMRPRAVFALLALEGVCLGATGSLLGTVVFLCGAAALGAAGVVSGRLSALHMAAGPALGVVASLAASLIPADAAQHSSPLDLLRAPH